MFFIVLACWHEGDGYESKGTGRGACRHTDIQRCPQDVRSGLAVQRAGGTIEIITRQDLIQLMSTRLVLFGHDILGDAVAMYIKQYPFGSPLKKKV